MYFDYARDSSQICQLGQFVSEYCENEMREKYGLRELKLPWGLGLKDIDKTKIYMTQDFMRPSKENVKRTGLILI